MSEKKRKVSIEEFDRMVEEGVDLSDLCQNLGQRWVELTPRNRDSAAKLYL